MKSLEIYKCWKIWGKGPFGSAFHHGKRTLRVKSNSYLESLFFKYNLKAPIKKSKSTLRIAF